MITLGKYIWYNGTPILPSVLFHKCGWNVGGSLGKIGMVVLGGTICNVCGSETPKNIMIAFKLWKWQNGK